MPENPFQPLIEHWVKKIRLGLDFKTKEFQDDADECYKFFDGPYDWLYDQRQQSKSFVWNGDESAMPKPTFSMTVNKVAELVELFGPVLYHKNPVRTVTPRKQPDLPLEAILPGGLDPHAMIDPGQAAVMQQQMMLLQQAQATRELRDTSRAALLTAYLNYTPEALNLKTESRWAIDEALIKGMGLLWTEVYHPPGSPAKLIGSFFGSVDDLVFDPDVKLLRECKWVARRCVHPVWQVEKEYGLKPGAVQGNFESSENQAALQANPMMSYWRTCGKTNDLLVYWKIWSKMGTGAKMSGVDPKLKEYLDPFGDFVFLVIAEHAPFPLNVPNELAQAQDVQAIQQAMQWPTPYWADDDWPFTPIIFHERPNKLYPMSHIKPGLGELKFINWVYSFIAGKIRTTCRDFLVLDKALAEEIKSAILHGSDLELLEIDRQHGTIRDLVEFLQHPQFNADIWKVLQAVEENFERRVGLNELMYGNSSRQLRSASEAQLKSNQIQVRPDDMATKVEEAMSQVARKEALAVRWHLTGQDVIPLFGPPLQQPWDQLLTASDPGEILFGLEYRIEAGSAKKPNKETDTQNAQTLMQSLFQPFWQYATMTGNVGPVNALIEILCKANDIDPRKILLPAPPPPPPAPTGPAAGGGGGGGGPPPPQPGGGPAGPAGPGG